ncbi:MAG: porin family protein [Flavobacteriales bacterium]
MGALFTSTLTNAQDGKSVRFGLQVAPHMAWLKSDTKNVSNDGSVLGFKFGLMSDFMIGQNQNYAFSTGLYYMVTTGVKAKTTISVPGVPDVTKSSEMKLSYVQLPLTIKLKTNEIGYMTYYGQIGADLGLRTSAKSEGEDVSDYVNAFRAGLVVGAGLEFNFSGNTSAMAGLTYNNGLTNLYTSKAGGKGKLNYLELNLGVFF